MMGLTFLSQAYEQAKRHEKAFRKIHHHNRLSFFQPKKLNEEQRAIIDSLNAQLDTSKLSKLPCIECGKKCVLLNANGIEIDYCLSCRGIWFDHNELKAFLQLPKDIPSDHLRHRDSHYDCPRCKVLMEEYVLLNPHNVLVDRCPQCLGVYLENDELERAFMISAK